MRQLRQKQKQRLEKTWHNKSRPLKKPLLLPGGRNLRMKKPRNREQMLRTLPWRKMRRLKNWRNRSGHKRQISHADKQDAKNWRIVWQKQSIVLQSLKGNWRISKMCRRRRRNKALSGKMRHSKNLPKLKPRVQKRMFLPRPQKNKVATRFVWPWKCEQNRRKRLFSGSGDGSLLLSYACGLCFLFLRIRGSNFAKKKTAEVGFELAKEHGSEAAVD